MTEMLQTRVAQNRDIHYGRVVKQEIRHNIRRASLPATMLLFSFITGRPPRQRAQKYTARMNEHTRQRTVAQAFGKSAVQRAPLL